MRDRSQDGPKLPIRVREVLVNLSQACEFECSSRLSPVRSLPSSLWTRANEFSFRHSASSPGARLSCLCNVCYLCLFGNFYSPIFSPAGPQSCQPASHPHAPVSTSLSMSSIAPTVTERALFLAANHSSTLRDHHSNSSSHHFTGNISHHSTSVVRNSSPTRLPLPGQTVQPVPVRPLPGQGNNSNHPPSKGPSVAQIFFEVIGGVAGTVVLLALLRCIYVYRKTPANRRPPTPEVAQVDRTMALLRTVPWRLPPDPPPPPPYQHAPDYTAVTCTNVNQDAQPPDRSLTPPEHGHVSQA